MFEEQDQLSFGFPSEEPLHATPKANKLKKARSGTFTDNMSLPVHRWFRYSAGFSAEWVQSLLRHHSLPTGSIVLDPFAGSGTTLIAANTAGYDAIGAESHHFVKQIADAKLAFAVVQPSEVMRLGKVVLDFSLALPEQELSAEAPLLRKCYSDETLSNLVALREAWRSLSPSDSPEARLVWLAITSILRECSGVGTAQWQYVLPNKSKAKVKNAFDAFHSKLKQISDDIFSLSSKNEGQSTLNLDDARRLGSLTSFKGKVSLVITSPPYPNNYDYADATRLEMTFWQEISGWSDLQKIVRKNLVRSCSQHSAAERLKLEELLSDPDVLPIKAELSAVCRELEQIRETKGGKKTYHTMVAAYFVDLAKCWKSLYELCEDGAHVYFVIGDSAPYGVYVPVDEWFGKLALSAGFSEWSFEKLRDRNIKWKNRKHTVPLKEGNLLVKK